MTSLTVPCDFDLKLFGWDAESWFTGMSGVQPAGDSITGFTPTNAMPYKVVSPDTSDLVDGGTFTLSHAWDEGVVTNSATCTEGGAKKLTCSSGCGATKTEAVDALGHEFVDGACWRCGATDPDSPLAPDLAPDESPYPEATVDVKG